jgi:hypothetical protein
VGRAAALPHARNRSTGLSSARDRREHPISSGSCIAVTPERVGTHGWLCHCRRMQLGGETGHVGAYGGRPRLTDPGWRGVPAKPGTTSQPRSPPLANFQARTNQTQCVLPHNLFNAFSARSAQTLTIAWAGRQPRSRLEGQTMQRNATRLQTFSRAEARFQLKMHHSKGQRVVRQPASGLWL